eukprot:scaffold5115_cov113-Isochrysis_galbana.AAC.9
MSMRCASRRMRDGDTLLYLYASSIATLCLPVPLPVPPARGALIVLAFARLWVVGGARVHYDGPGEGRSELVRELAPPVSCLIPWSSGGQAPHTVTVL